jgi:hypothetical protein
MDKLKPILLALLLFTGYLASAQISLPPITSRITSGTLNGTTVNNGTISGGYVTGMTVNGVPPGDFSSFGTSMTLTQGYRDSTLTYRNQTRTARDVAVTAALNCTVNLGNLATSATISLSGCANTTAYGTLTGNTTLTITDIAPGKYLELELVQGGAGSFTATFPASVRFPGGAAIDWNTTAGTFNTFYLKGRPLQGGYTLAGAYLKN